MNVFTSNTLLCSGSFSGGEIEPGTFHGGEIEPGTFHTPQSSARDQVMSEAASPNDTDLSVPA